jgi:hypothetical protein
VAMRAASVTAAVAVSRISSVVVVDIMVSCRL